jgi:hypothetical protein
MVINQETAKINAHIKLNNFPDRLISVVIHKLSGSTQDMAMPSWHLNPTERTATNNPEDQNSITHRTVL